VALISIILYVAESTAQNQMELPQLKVSIAAFDFPPMAHRAANGAVSGRAVETVREFCEASNMQCEILFYPAARAYREFESGGVDALLSGKVGRLEQCCSFADWYYPFRAGFIADRPVDDIPETEEELHVERIVMIGGWRSAYSYFPNLAELETANKVQITQSNSIVAAINMYESDRVTLFWGSDAFDWHFNKLSLSNDKRNFRALMSFPAGMFVTRLRENHDEILHRFNQVFKTYKDLGNLDEDNILIPDLLKDTYQDAPLPE